MTTALLDTATRRQANPDEAVRLCHGVRAGALVTLQIASNSKLKETVGATVPAAIASSLFGVVLLGAAMAVMQMPWPTFDKLLSAPWSAWIGGAFGAFYALVTIGLAWHLGATTLVTLVVVGQLICSVVVDHFGVFGFEARAASVVRLTGCPLLLRGFFLIWRY